MTFSVMQPAIGIWGDTVAPRLRGWWSAHRVGALRCALALLAAFTALKLSESFWRLLIDPGQYGAIDLRLRVGEVHRWFAGQPVYAEQPATYPPASYALLWPLMGWLDFAAARWLWAVTSVAALAWLAHILVSASRAKSTTERAVVVLLLLSMNATGVTIGNGQLLFHFLPGLLFAIVPRSSRPNWVGQVLAAALLLAGLVKPTISVPFLWAALFVSGTWWTAVCAGSGYVGVTLFAAAFQPGSLADLLAAWLSRGLAVAEHGGYANLHIWLAGLGLQRWDLPASAAVLGGLGVWTYRRRTADAWIVLGVVAIVARLWAYHQVYDDVLIGVAAIALFRVAKQGSAVDGSDMLAGVLLAINTLVMLAPARLAFPMSPWLPVLSATHTLVWIAMLVFLLYQAEPRGSTRHA